MVTTLPSTPRYVTQSALWRWQQLHPQTYSHLLANAYARHWLLSLNSRASKLYASQPPRTSLPVISLPGAGKRVGLAASLHYLLGAGATGLGIAGLSPVSALAARRTPLSLSRAWVFLFRHPALFLSMSVGKGYLDTIPNNLVLHPSAIRPRRRFAARMTWAQAHNMRVKEDAMVGDVLIRFLETLSRSRVWFRLDRRPQKAFSAADKGYSFLLTSRIARHTYVVRARRKWRYIGICIFLMFKSRDPQFLISWIQLRLTTMSAFRHKRFLATTTFFIKTALAEVGTECGVVGSRLDVVGKISVTGNARSRSLIFKRGLTGLTDSTIKASSAFYLVRTATGCLGLTLWLFHV